MRHRPAVPSAKAFRHPNDEVRSGLRGVGQRCDRCAIAVLLAKRIDLTELDCALRARFDANGKKPLLQTVEARVALRHLARLRVKDRRAVGTGFCTHAATDALFAVDQNKTVFLALVVRFRRTDLHAGGVGTVVAGNGHVIGKHVLVPGARRAVLTPGAFFVGVHRAEIAPGFEVVLILASDDARFATRALRNINAA